MMNERRLIKRIKKEGIRVIGIPENIIKFLLHKELIESDKNLLTKEDKEDLVAYLEEYLRIFRDKKVHNEAHKRKPCMICNRAKELLRKLKGK